MPTYEYRCLDCRRKFALFMSYEQYDQESVRCNHCDSPNVRRLIGRIRIAKSEDSRLDDLAGDFSDPAALEGLEDDPRALGRMMRKMSHELGEEMGPEFDEVVNRLEKGQSPEEIESAMPDLGMDGDGGLGAGFDD
jgi:putative FmdB family regulatory protein